MGARTVLLVGGGGREHALGWRLRQGASCGRLLCAPGNPGLAALPGVTCLPVSATDLDGIREIVRREEVELLVVGPEAPLQAGLADAVAAERGERTAIFGPSAAAAEIETSKVFAKGFMARHRIATAAFSVVRDGAEAEAFLAAQAAAGRRRFVVKADGLHAGKGVTVCGEIDEALAAARAAVAGGEAAVIEERLVGREASCLALCDGEEVLPLWPCEDHKTIFDGDRGPMTGGMGVVCPTPVMDEALLQRVRDEVLRPAARGLAAEGRPFRGVLYAGIMLTAEGPRVLEYNVRFGDPECAVLLARLDGDVVPWILGGARGALDPGDVRLRDVASLGVVVAAEGYPEAPRRGVAIGGLEVAAQVPHVQIFHAGTARAGDAWVTAGGRVVLVVATAHTFGEARARAYEAVDAVELPGARVRRDIGWRAARGS